MKYSILAIILNVLCTYALHAQKIELGLENLKFKINPPEGLMRIDDSDLELLGIIKASVPATNHLLAAYAVKAKDSGENSEYTTPYVSIQTIKSAVKNGGMNGTTMAIQINKILTMFGSIHTSFDANAAEQIRQAVNEKARARANGGFETTEIGLKPFAVTSKSDTHITTHGCPVNRKNHL